MHRVTDLTNQYWGRKPKINKEHTLNVLIAKLPIKFRNKENIRKVSLKLNQHLSKFNQI